MTNIHLHPRKNERNVMKLLNLVYRSERIPNQSNYVSQQILLTKK
ncbi:hypothetical protein ACPEIA_07800 [Lysinibacillus sp. NPDC101784]|nr:hypothetical protein [Lysinibacillus sphaericus]